MYKRNKNRRSSYIIINSSTEKKQPSLIKMNVYKNVYKKLQYNTWIKFVKNNKRKCLNS